MQASITLYTDSSAARGIIHRAGLGKLRHLETGYIWLQSDVKAKTLQARKVLGIENPAELLTKHLSATDVWKNLEKATDESGGRHVQSRTSHMKPFQLGLQVMC